MGGDVIDGITCLKQLHILKAIFESVFLAHNKTPKVFCLTFGVHVSDASAFFRTRNRSNIESISRRPGEDLGTQRCYSSDSRPQPLMTVFGDIDKCAYLHKDKSFSIGETP